MSLRSGESEVSQLAFEKQEILERRQIPSGKVCKDVPPSRMVGYRPLVDAFEQQNPSDLTLLESGNAILIRKLQISTAKTGYLRAVLNRNTATARDLRREGLELREVILELQNKCASLEELMHSEREAHAIQTRVLHQGYEHQLMCLDSQVKLYAQQVENTRSDSQHQSYAHDVENTQKLIFIQTREIEMAFRESTCWKLTRPLRMIKELLQRLFSGA